MESENKKIKAVIFDLDGTLLDTLDDLADSCNQALGNFNFPARSREEIRQFVGNGIALLMERAIPDGRKNPQFENCLTELKSIYGKNCRNKTKPYDGIIDAIKKLNSLQIKTGIVSNKPDQQVKELAKLYFSECMNEKTAVGERAGIERKPAPDSLFEVMKILNVKPEETIYVGDSDVDIETAKNADCKCISVNWGFRDTDFLKLHHAQCIVNNTEELLDQILS